MLRGLQAGFGEPLGATTLLNLSALGVDGVRLDCQTLLATPTQQLVKEARAFNLIPLPIISRPSQLEVLPPGTNVEFLNEPDLNGPDPESYRLRLMELVPAAEKAGVRLWAGSVSNLNARGLGYLAATRPDTWPASVHVTVHRYQTGANHLSPHACCRSRGGEVINLRRIIGARPFGVSEFGYHTARRWRWGIIPVRFSDAQVADMVAWEWKFWEGHAARFAVLYQLNDGPTTAAIDRFGIRRTDGTWKPVAGTFQR
jgi:hypothetical protein